jgi:hypothetical protein
MVVDRGLVVQWGVGRGRGSCDGQRCSEEQHAEGRSHGSLRIKQRANGPLLYCCEPRNILTYPPPPPPPQTTAAAAEREFTIGLIKHVT